MEPHPLFNPQLLAALLLIAPAVATVVYNLFFHPLRHYPGPFLAKVTRWTWAYHTFNGNLTAWVDRAHEQYGDVVRVAPNELSYISSQAWPDIYGHKTTTGQGNLQREIRYKPSHTNGVHSIITAGDKDHRRMRKLLAHMFSDKAFAEQEPFITGYIDMLIKQLNKKAESPGTSVVDLVKWYNFTTFDILGDLAFGESFQCLETDNLHPWISMIFTGAKAAQFQTAASYFPWPLNKLVLYLSPKALFQARKDQFMFAYQQARKRVAQGITDRNDFMSHILRFNDEKRMTQGEIESNSQILIVAGSETTATFLSGVTYNLLRTPTVLQTLTRLIRFTFASEASINNLELQKLPYLTSVVEEGLRIYPPVPTGFPRRTPAEGSIICEQFVPGNTVVSVHQWPAYNSPRNFADPKLFVPERWAKDGTRGARYEGDNTKVLQPFSVGPRNCLGMNLAYAEMRLILARMLWNFDLELQTESEQWADQKVWLLWEKKPLLVKLSPRNE